MGWMFSYKASSESVEEYLRKRIDCQNECGSHRLLKMSVRGSVAYAAIEMIPSKGEPYVYGGVFLTSKARDPRYNFGYKDMDESMGPYSYDCPKHILDMLTPIEVLERMHPDRDYKHAREWRETCIAKAKDKPDLKPGDTVSFPEPIGFRNGARYRTFTYKGIMRRSRVFESETGVLVRLTPKFLSDHKATITKGEPCTK